MDTASGKTYLLYEFAVSGIILPLCETKLVSASGIRVHTMFPLTEGQLVTVLVSRTYDLRKQSHIHTSGFYSQARGIHVYTISVMRI
jgi:hypothetical protein